MKFTFKRLLTLPIVLFPLSFPLSTFADCGGALSAFEGYEQLAKDYDAYTSSMVIFADQLEPIRNRYVGGLPRRRNALDLGIGTGRELPFLEKNFERVTGVDQSPSMLAIADRKRAFKTQLFLSDINSFKSVEKFDFIHSTLSLKYLKDVDSFFAKAAALLDDRGIVWLVDTAEDALRKGHIPTFSVKQKDDLAIQYFIHTPAEILEIAANHGLAALDWKEMDFDQTLEIQYPQLVKYRNQKTVSYFVFMRAR